MPKLKYSYFENVYKTLWIKRLIPILKRILKDKPNFFLKINDVISHRPLIDGTYEPSLKALYTSLGRNGFNDFYIDIGANVGLSSALVSEEFKQFFLFEPNPLIFKILEVNSYLNFKSESYHLFNYGLGSHDDNIVISIPRNNWGGGVVDSSDNHYDKSLLTGKDGFNKVDNNNYIKLNAEIKKTDKEIRKIMLSVKEQGLKSGVIKIDVEGFEEVVINGISSVIPDDFSVVIIFENWSKKFNLKGTINSFGNRIDAYKLHRDSKKSWPRLAKGLFLLFGGKYSYSLKKIDSNSNIVGDLVYHIKPTTEN
ncbi:MAG TPA: FkbM family methyltransferase [Candidatus Thioglobus sp.]|nr:FkbM family methyltransferase [Candidatus Thioglobus sp.]